MTFLEAATLPQYQAFLAAIKESPSDDTPRLILADWLDEQGVDEYGDFIRVSIEADRFKWKCRGGHFCSLICPCPGCWHHKCLRSCEQKILSTDKPPITSVHTCIRGGVLKHNPYGWLGTWGLTFEWCDFARGFVEKATTTTDYWVKCADDFLTIHPVR